MNTESIENTLIQMIAAFEGVIPAAQLKDMEDLTRSGEPGIAFENLCTQIYEYDVSVQPAVVSELRRIGIIMDIQPKYWERIAVRE